MTSAGSRSRTQRTKEDAGAAGPSVTMRDVARLAGVGAITVSRALQHPDRVTAETRRKIDEAIAALGYVPNLAAGTLRSSKSRIIVAIVPTMSNSIFAETLQSISDVLRPAGFHLLIGHTGYSAAEEEALIAAFLARRPDGVILTGYTHTPRTVELLKRARIPVIEMWNIGPDPIDTIIGMSSYDASLAMTRYLIRKGYRRIGYIGGLLQDNDRTVQREAGFRAGLEEAGRPFDPAMIMRAPFEFESGGIALDELMRRMPDVDAVFAASDILAVGVLLECLGRGIDVPGRLAVAGFDDAGIASRMTPPLTTIRVPRRAIGRTIAERMLARLAGKPAGERIVDLGFELIERASA